MKNNHKLTTTQLALTLAILTVGSKLLGFIRELLLANYYGASYITDAYTMSMSIPNNLLAGIVGAAATAYMPVFSKKVEEQGEDAGNTFTSQIINLLLCVVGVVMILGWIFAEPLVHLFAPGFQGETFELTTFYIRVAFVMVFFSVIANMLGSYLEYKGVFVLPTLLTYLQNICIISAIIICAKTNTPEGLIFGITTGFLLMAVSKIIIAKKHGYKYTADFNFSKPVKEIIVLAVPVFIGSSAGEINALIDRILASNLSEGSVSALQYGNLFSGLISSLTITVFVTIIYPRLTQAFALNDFERISDVSERGINLIALLMVPCTLGALVYASPAIQVVYERGAFNAVATDLTAAAFFYYGIGMAFTATRSFLDKIFYSVHDTVTPVKCSIVAVFFNIVLNITLVKVMGHAGLALATSISQIISTLLEYYLFGKKFPQITLLKSKRKLARIILFSIISVGISYLFFYFVGNVVWMPRMLLLGGAVMIAALIYLLLLYIFKFEELELFKDLINRK
ncbi:MAG: murein biosynthesis integral membrane protein MurJ [Bacillota bacterium]|nr:murein biosynthesis integral membrane protein MurJ [Bacillota bacterium]